MCFLGFVIAIPNISVRAEDSRFAVVGSHKVITVATVTLAGAVSLDIGSFDIPGLMAQAGDKAPEMYRYAFPKTATEDAWRDSSPHYHVRAGKTIPPLMLCFVDGRDHHERENERFAKLVTDTGGKATVVRARGKTHLSLEAEIGMKGDAITPQILNFIETVMKGSVAKQ